MVIGTTITASNPYFLLVDLAVILVGTDELGTDELGAELPLDANTDA